jgi:hypothetical protein
VISISIHLPLRDPHRSVALLPLEKKYRLHSLGFDNLNDPCLFTSPFLYAPSPLVQIALPAPLSRSYLHRHRLHLPTNSFRVNLAQNLLHVLIDPSPAIPRVVQEFRQSSFRPLPSLTRLEGMLSGGNVGVGRRQ